MFSPALRVSDSVNLFRGPRIHISDKFAADADAGSRDPTLRTTAATCCSHVIQLSGLCGWVSYSENEHMKSPCFSELRKNFWDQRKRWEEDPGRGSLTKSKTNDHRQKLEAEWPSAEGKAGTSRQMRPQGGEYPF